EQNAAAVVAALPAKILRIIESSDWAGASLIQLEEGLCRPSAADVQLNYHYLKPLIILNPGKVPSAYFLTDIVLRMDEKCDFKLVPPTAKESRLDVAASQGCKLKRLFQALRALWRSSATGNHPRVTELKSYLVASATSPQKPKEPAEQEGEEGETSAICHQWQLSAILTQQFAPPPHA
ncbi:unnamed protein product, partial [Effrenium voratum]